MVIAIGCDHRGFDHKQQLLEYFSANNIEYIDVGAFDIQRSDYPEFAIKVAQAIQQKKADAGILICGSGVGMAITANRFEGIYAGVVWNSEVARVAREHDNVNVLVLPSDYISIEVAQACVMHWMQAHFLGDRYQQRITMINELGGLNNK